MSTTNEKYREDLTAYLLEVATGSGYLKGTLLNTPDLDEAWQRYAPSFYGDAVREFNAYPEYCLACAGYLGMAVAHLWDKDWPKYTDTPYSFFLISVEVMYQLGVAIWLNKLGYKFEKVNLV